MNAKYSKLFFSNCKFKIDKYNGKFISNSYILNNKEKYSIFKKSGLYLVNQKYFCNAKPNIELIKILRKETNSPLNQIQKSLIENNNNLEEAKVWLKKRGFKDAENKMSRESGKKTYGLLLINDKDYNQNLCITEISCETDFVANTDDFRNFCLVVQSTLQSLQSTQNIDNTQNIEIINNINSNNANINLLDTTKSLIAKTGENCKVIRMEHIIFKNHEVCGIYLHGNINLKNHCSSGAYCVLSINKNVNNTNIKKELIELANLLSMQIVAMNPIYISKESIPDHIYKKEIEIIEDKLKNTYTAKNSKPKSKEIMDKMINNSYNKFLEEKVLLEQVFVINKDSYDSGSEDKNDPEKNTFVKVKDYIKNISKNLDVDIKIIDFNHYK